MSTQPTWNLKARAWHSERRRLCAFLDAKPSFREALDNLIAYHQHTEYAATMPSDFVSERFPNQDGTLQLHARSIPARARRYDIKEKKQPPEGVTPVHDGCPLAPDNIVWQQAGRQFPYPKRINGVPFNWLLQYSPFGRRHFTIAGNHPEPQDWHPDRTLLSRRLKDMYAIAALCDALVIWNGCGAGAGITNWFHFQSLQEEPIPMDRALGLAGRRTDKVLRLGEPYWPLPAFCITGSADMVAAEVVKLATRNNELGGTRATESIAMYPHEGMVKCIYVPRDREREYVKEFGGKLGAFEVCVGVLVFSSGERWEWVNAAPNGFELLWSMLRCARPEWSDEI